MDNIRENSVLNIVIKPAFTNVLRSLCRRSTQCVLEYWDGNELLWFETQLPGHSVKWVKVATLVLIPCNTVYKPVITRPLMEVTHSLVRSHDSTTVFFTLLNIIPHILIKDQTHSLITVITLTIIEITRYLKPNIYTFSLR